MAKLQILPKMGIKMTSISRSEIFGAIKEMPESVNPWGSKSNSIKHKILSLIILHIHQERLKNSFNKTNKRILYDILESDGLKIDTARKYIKGAEQISIGYDYIINEEIYNNKNIQELAESLSRRIATEAGFETVKSIADFGKKPR